PTPRDRARRRGRAVPPHQPRRQAARHPFARSFAPARSLVPPPRPFPAHGGARPRGRRPGRRRRRWCRPSRSPRARGARHRWACRDRPRIRSGAAPWPDGRTNPPPRARSERSTAPASPRGADRRVGGDGRRREGVAKPSLSLPRRERTDDVGGGASRGAIAHYTVEVRNLRRWRRFMQGETVPAKRFARLSSVLRASFGLVVDVALPQLCPTCREPVHGAGLCPACWSKLSFIAPPYCERLGIPFPFDGGPGLLSIEAIADPPAYNRARAAVRYDDIARQLLHALKYGDRLDLAPAMGRWMARAGRELLADSDAIVPVPLHWRRQWARRFNQSALLAEIIAKTSGRMVAHGALKRVKATPQQVGL